MMMILYHKSEIVSFITSAEFSKSQEKQKTKICRFNTTVQSQGTELKAFQCTLNLGLV